MATIGAIKSEGQKAIASQRIKDEAKIYKALVIQIDSFVEALVDRLENPNKTFFGSKAPVDPADVKFKECVKAVKTFIGNAVKYRGSITKTVPPQYGKLSSIMTNIAEGAPLKDKYNVPRLDFLNGFKNFMVYLSGESTTKIPECSPYSRVSNLFNSITKDPKYHFDYKVLYNELTRITKRVDNVIERKEVEEILDELMEEIALDVRTTSAYPPIAPGSSATTTSSSTPGEPAPNVSQSDIESELSSTTTTSSSQPKKPLTSADKMKIAGIAAQISRDPRSAQRQLSMAQIQQMAENIYRKKTGMGRKTYKKKINRRKTRKVRRV